MEFEVLISWKGILFNVTIIICSCERNLMPRTHGANKTCTLFAQIRPELLDTDREYEQLKEFFFAHVNATIVRAKKNPLKYLN